MAKQSDTLDRLNELRELGAKNVDDNGLLTAAEMARQTGKTAEAIRKLLHQANDLGCLVRGEKMVTVLSGRCRRDTAYKILPLPKGKR